MDSPNIYVLSPLGTNPNHAGFSVLYDLEELFESLGAKIIGSSGLSRFVDKAWPFRKFSKQYEIDVAQFNEVPNDATLIILCLTPHFLCSLRGIKSELDKFKSVNVYFLDGFDSRSMDNMGKEILDGVDNVFSIVEESAEDMQGFVPGKSVFLPLGVDALGYATKAHKKTIDVFSYGRGDARYHCALEAELGEQSNEFLYIHTTMTSPFLTSMREHRRMNWKTLQRSKLSFCFEGSAVPRFQGRSPILYRWLECIAAGVTIVGTRPKCAAMNNLFGWEDSTIEVPEAPIDFPVFIKELLSDEVRLNASSKANRYHALTKHDWRYRIQEILLIADMQMPKVLENGLASLAEEVRNFD